MLDFTRLPNRIQINFNVIGDFVPHGLKGWTVYNYLPYFNSPPSMVAKLDDWSALDIDHAG